MPQSRPLVVLAVLAPIACAAACFSSSSSPGPSPLPDAGETPVDAGNAADAGQLVDAGPSPDAGQPLDSGAPNDTGAPVDASPDTGTGLDSGEDGTAPIVDAASDALAEAAVVHQSLSALQFDGVDDWVHLPAADGGASTTAFTVELWFRTSNATGNMFEIYDSGGGADRFLCMTGGSVCFYVFNTAGAEICTPAGSYDDGAWHHAAGTLGATGGMNLYVDGAFAATNATLTSSSFTAGSDFRLGYGHTTFESALVYFGGDLDEVRVWSVERSASDIAADYKQEIAPSTAGLQGYWKLEETGPSMTAADSTTGGHDGQLTNFTYTPSPWISPGAF